METKNYNSETGKQLKIYFKDEDEWDAFIFLFKQMKKKFNKPDDKENITNFLNNLQRLKRNNNNEITTSLYDDNLTDMFGLIITLSNYFAREEKNKLLILHPELNEKIDKNKETPE